MFVAKGAKSIILDFEKGVGKADFIYLQVHNTMAFRVTAELAQSRDYGLPYVIIYDATFLDSENQSFSNHFKRLSKCREIFQDCVGTHRVIVWDYSFSYEELFSFLPNLCFHSNNVISYSSA